MLGSIGSNRIQTPDKAVKNKNKNVIWVMGFGILSSPLILKIETTTLRLPLMMIKK